MKKIRLDITASIYYKEGTYEEIHNRDFCKHIQDYYFNMIIRSCVEKGYIVKVGNIYKSVKKIVKPILLKEGYDV